MFDTNEVVYGDVMAKEVGLKWQFQDMIGVIKYGKHFLQKEVQALSTT